MAQMEVRAAGEEQWHMALGQKVDQDLLWIEPLEEETDDVTDILL